MTYNHQKQTNKQTKVERNPKMTDILELVNKDVKTSTVNILSMFKKAKDNKISLFKKPK